MECIAAGGRQQDRSPAESAYWKEASDASPTILLQEYDSAVRLVLPASPLDGLDGLSGWHSTIIERA